MIISGVFKSDLRVVSKETALEFYKGVKSLILIPYEEDYVIRVEPGNLISAVSKEDINKGNAWMTPSIEDDDGSIAYHYRKYINAYLSDKEK